MTRQPFSPEPVLSRLYPFQRRTVDHVIRRFYGPDPTTRFLVADETGLGKSIVARGVIARAISKLQNDPATDRIDVVYICSNADLARQNLERVNVTADVPAQASRLTMLAAAKGRLHSDNGRWTKPISLVSFTPGTSMDTKGLGTVEERLLLLHILGPDLELATAWDRRAALRVVQGHVGALATMEKRQKELVAGWNELDPTVVQEIRSRAHYASTDRGSFIGELRTLVQQHRRQGAITPSVTNRAHRAVARGREILVRAGLAALSPDLVILDEFQRFDELLRTDNPSGELAEQMFNHPRARVLMLSATPFKPFTLAEERDEQDHQQALFRTLDFLAKGGSHHSIDSIKRTLGAYRSAVLSNDDTSELAQAARRRLLPLMCRTERPTDIQRARVRETVHTVTEITVEDVLEYASLAELAEQVEGHFSVEYWKSAPYFANFMDGYQLHAKAQEYVSPREYLTRTLRTLPMDQIDANRAIDLGNGKLRALAQGTVEVGWEQLLWVPPSLPYTEPAGPFANNGRLTKKLIFSSWKATPGAVAALLTYEADRRLAELAGTTDRRRRPTARLQYRLAEGRAASLSTLALFWPLPSIARLADPLAVARSHGHAVDSDVVQRKVEAVVIERLGAADHESTASGSERAYWAAAFAVGSVAPASCLADPDGIAGLLAPVGDPHQEEGSAGARAHVEEVGGLNLDDEPAWPPDLAATVASIAAFSPANTAWRALGRLLATGDNVSDEALWRAAAVVADGLRSLFNKPEAMDLLDGLYGQDERYWRAVLQYCADGNLQAVLDEYLHQLANEVPGPLDDERIDSIATRARNALSLRRATFRVSDPYQDEPVSLGASFAMRYGDRAGSTAAGARPEEVRHAFNSPFWPFVLTSTSVGQEGIDFHPWCHSLVHWNIPANPVDFEQREGRIDRFRGHAVRRNIAADLGAQVLRAPRSGHPWDLAFQLAENSCEQRDRMYGAWLYDGDAKIERTIYVFPFSKDQTQLDRVKDDLAKYRLAFGQGRQEEFTLLLAGREHAPIRLRP